ncbi:MAG: N-(5'-phosphoribosyl)anthranilate isomerase [Gemmatimonadota bacterium]
MTSRRLAVKVCGLTRPEDALLAARLGASALGVVFAPSPRRLDPRRAAVVLRGVPPDVVRVGVFVDPPPELVAQAVIRCALHWIQLSGDESAELAAELGAVAQRAAATSGRNAPPRILKTVHVQSPAELLAAADYPADGFLLDAPACDGRRGGTGRRFDWNAAASLPWPRERVVLAGGLSPSNLAAAVSAVRPGAVDVCSAVEARPGIKDPGRMTAFLVAARLVRIADVPGEGPRSPSVLADVGRSEGGRGSDDWRAALDPATALVAPAEGSR